jgi:hypothetical protein
MFKIVCVKPGKAFGCCEYAFDNDGRVFATIKREGVLGLWMSRDNHGKRIYYNRYRIEVFDWLKTYQNRFNIGG